MTDCSSIPPAVGPTEYRRIPVQPEGGWLEIRDEDRRGMPYWRPCASFAVALDAARQGLQPFLTLRQMRAICVEGRYAPFQGVQPRCLRRPEEILGSQSSISIDGDSIPADLTWEEAELFCRLAGGMLADETQVLHILRHLIPSDWPKTRLPDAPGWTRSPWSEWSEALLAFHAGTKRWIAAEDRALPDLAAGTGLRTRVHARATPCRRHGAPGPLSPGAGAAAWLVYPS